MEERAREGREAERRETVKERERRATQKEALTGEMRVDATKKKRKKRYKVYSII